MIVFLNGCFDLLTPAHFNLLSYAKGLSNGGHVRIAIDSDRKIKEDKGQYRPIHSFEERKSNLLILKDSNGNYLVDSVLMFDTNEELYDLIKLYKPDYLVKGSEWHGNVIGSGLTEVRYFDRDNPYSSTSIISKVLHKYQNVSNFQQECLARMANEAQKLKLY